MDERHPINVFVGHRIRSKRKDRGLSQAELGDAIGKTYQMVQKYERGVSSISVPLLFKVAGVLEENVVSFLPMTLRPSSLSDPEIIAAFDLLMDALAKYERPR